MNIGMENINVRYEHNNNVNYAVIDIDYDNEPERDYEIKMLMLNMPEHFLRFMLNEIDGNKCVYYDISSRQQLSKLFEYGKISMEDVKMLFLNISQMVRVVEEYMLDLDRVILEPQYIYVSMANRKYDFMYSPYESKTDFYEKMRLLFEYVLERFDHSIDKTSVVRFYEIYQRILIRDYTPYNLMEFFGDEKSCFIEQSEEKDTFENIKQNENTLENDYDNNEFIPENDNEGMVLKSVMPQIIEKEKKNDNGRLAAVIIKLLSVAVIVNAALNLFIKEYALINLSIIAAVFSGAAAFLLFYKSGKICRFIADLLSEDKVTEDELIPYRLKNNTKNNVKNEIKNNNKNADKNYTIQNSNFSKNENKLKNLKAREERETQKADEYKFLNEIQDFQESGIEAKIIENEDAFKAQENHTMLLSDYMASLKSKTLTLELIKNDNKIYKKENQDYKLVENSIKFEDSPCTIGSLKGTTDIFIDNPAVSKLHACVSKNGDEYYIEDINSTNGTYINDERIKVHNKVILKEGDILKIADCGFKVKNS